MSVALCPQLVSRASQHFRYFETQATCDGCFPASLFARSVPSTPASPGQHVHSSLRKWMSYIDTCRSGLPIPLGFPFHWASHSTGLSIPLGFPFHWASHSTGLPIPLFTSVAANLCGNQPVSVKGRDQTSSTGLLGPSSNQRHHWLHRSLSLVIRWQ